jgi:hypothetical protein
MLPGPRSLPMTLMMYVWSCEKLLKERSLSWMPEKKRRAYLGKQAMAQREAEQKET